MSSTEWRTVGVSVHEEFTAAELAMVRNGLAQKRKSA